jgi:hypothetical protein
MWVVIIMPVGRAMMVVRFLAWLRPPAVVVKLYRHGWWRIHHVPLILPI